MAIIKCPTCNCAYNDSPKFHDNGIVRCPKCHHMPSEIPALQNDKNTKAPLCDDKTTNTPGDGTGCIVVVSGVITFGLAWLLNPLLSYVGWILAALMTFVLIPLSIAQTKETQDLRDRQQVEQQDFISKNNIRRSAEYTYQDKLNSKKIRFIVDKSNQKIYISETSSRFKEYAFKDILGCEIVTDSQVTGGIKRAIVGGVLAGDAGAVVGAVTAKPHIMSYKLVLYLRDISAPKTEIELITQKTKTKDTDYTNAVSFAENVVATVKAILASVS